MSGVGFHWDIANFAALQRRVDLLSHMDTRELMDGVGAEVASQWKRRIEFEKTTPQGVAWAPWSNRYKKTRTAGQSLLFSERHLWDSITHLLSLDGKEVDVGSNLIYARTQNKGRGKIPARQFAGLSSENKQDLREIANDWINQQLTGGLQ
ncbi:phage virion morphogenesis protein [Dyella lutea]|uniref:Phage virion morphogenesis protein n=1 Tax=Dyella lutea TaxID=2950441 RepID=A0ABT1FG45_9GAMM|nr:phage virion morphogenesis protein [Dyella lutea]MCP1375388.1 phage virion morphogenesis protein [Dyella lutea]